MKVIIKDKLTTVYPCIKVSPHSRIVVLLSSENTGTVLEPGYSSRDLGEYVKDWIGTRDWELLNGEVVLSN